MTFTTISFVLFLALTFALYWSVRQRFAQNVLLLAASYAFYAWWDYRFCGLMLLASLIDFVAGAMIDQSQSHRARRAWLVASIVAKDEGNDVALLRVDEDLPTGLPVADGEAGLGATVFTLGYPHTGIMGRNVKLSTGIISSQTGLRDDSRTYQISVPVQAGNSGGPLINSRGEVVGLVTAKLSAAQVFRWTGDLPQNVNYAVKVAYLNALMPAEHSAVANQPATDADLEALVARATPAVVLVIAD